MSSKKENFKQSVRESIESALYALQQEINLNYEGQPNGWHNQVKMELKSIETLLKIY